MWLSCGEGKRIHAGAGRVRNAYGSLKNGATCLKGTVGLAYTLKLVVVFGV